LPAIWLKEDNKVVDLLKVKGLKKYFPRGKKQLKAVDNVQFNIKTGETLGLVGESGSGKSTLGRSILRLVEPTAGDIYFDNIHINQLGKEKLRLIRKEMQIIFQDPYSSLNPQMTVFESIHDPLKIHKIGTKIERKEKVEEMLDIVEVGKAFADAYPCEFSGGQQQRIGIARALILRPRFIVCDEPVSALDVSIQAQIISLLIRLKEKYNLSFLFISHDLAVVKYISDKVAVMYLGQIVEIGKKELIFKNPLHPYTKALIDSVPKIPKGGKLQKRYKTLEGEIPSPIDLPKGCCFQSRCPIASKVCIERDPVLEEYNQGQKAACFHISS
jgi:oligopeptide/dipeptide ABC transporter ATP-binding protein